MTLVAPGISIILFSIAVLHAAWAFGALWPAKDEQALVDTVIGSPGLTKMPGRLLTLIAAAGIAAAGICAPWGAGLIELPLPDWMQATSVPILMLIFGLRGVSSYAAGSIWRRTEPFATLDRRYYAPLCLLLALGFGLIFLNMLEAATPPRDGFSAASSTSCASRLPDAVRSRRENLTGPSSPSLNHSTCQCRI